jgi:hypothetical protein
MKSPWTINIYLKKMKDSQALVAYTCNPSYSGGRDQEDHGSKPAWANCSRDPISKKHFTKKGGGVAQGEGSEFESQYHTQKKEKKMKGRRVNRSF